MLHHVLVAIKKPFLKLVPIPEPQCWVGANISSQIPEVLTDYQCHRPLVVTDPALHQMGLLDAMLGALSGAGLQPKVFSDVTPDPASDLVRRGVELYQQHGCDCVIALGGGSAIDCAKALAASATTGKDITKLTGLLKVRRRLPPIIAIPTTAGSGSEATVAAVITDNAAKCKRVVTDPFIVPKLAILDPTLLTALPARMTAETGVDALTHAIESYLSTYANSYTRQLSIDAVKAILAHLPTAYAQGTDLAARKAMSVASFKAGVAFTRTYVGYVHALAHQLGGYYKVPHGQANAIVLPKILHFYFDSAHAQLAELARGAGLCDERNDLKAARIFVERIGALLNELNMPVQVAQLQETDIPELARRAMAEAFGVYPVPRRMSVRQCEQIYHTLLPEPAT